MEKRVMKRKYLVGLFVLLAASIASTWAWSINTITAENEKVYVNQYGIATGAVTSFKSFPVGKNVVEIRFKVSGANGICNVTLMNTLGNPMTVNSNTTYRLYSGGAWGDWNSVSDTELTLRDQAYVTAGTDFRIQFKGATDGTSPFIVRYDSTMIFLKE